MQYTLISVIIPVYNVEPYLERCLQSVCNQTYKNLEIILIDDGSNDGSAEICDTFAKKDRRICVIHLENQGVYAARNVGLDICKGEYICFVDSDDYMAIHMLKLLYEYMKEAGTDLAACSCYVVKNKNTFVNHIIRNGYHSYTGEEFLSLVFEIKLLSTLWGKLYSRQLFQVARFLEFPSCADTVIWISLWSRMNRVVLIDNPAYYYVRRSGSLTVPVQFDLTRFPYVKAAVIVRNYIASTVPNKNSIGELVYYVSLCVTLRHIYLSHTEAKYALEVRKMRECIKCGFYHILKNNHISFCWKVGLGIAAYMPILFVPAYKIYMFLFGNHEL